jgi:hypothetical protein
MQGIDQATIFHVEGMFRKWERVAVLKMFGQHFRAKKEIILKKEKECTQPPVDHYRPKQNICPEKRRQYPFHKLSAMSYQQSAFSYQQSAGSYELSAGSSQLSVIG